MEDKNYRDDFENFLKESADDFRMIPSRKVWYSIYNNMHPDRRWPSMTVCLLILTAVLYIGIENNNALSSAAKRNASENFITNLNKNAADKNLTSSQPNVKTSLTSKQQQTLPSISISSEYLSETATMSDEQFPVLTINNTVTAANQLENVVSVNDGVRVSDNNKNKVSTSGQFKITIKNSDATGTENSITTTTIPDQSDSNIDAEIENASLNKKITSVTNPGKEKALKDLLLTTEKSWKEDYAFRNKPAINKIKENGSLSYYITPSLGYRVFKKRDPNKIPNYANSFSGRSLFGDRQLDDNDALSLEIGAAFNYKVSKNIRVKTGVQANYTNYTSKVTALGHPSQVALDVSSNPQIESATSFTSASGKEELNRSTLQLSIPVGADVKIAGKGKFKWYIAATMQPTYLVKGSGYVLSSDAAYYASEPSLLRKLNLNAALETFVSFKTSAGISVNIGPQFRYQLFSTYKKEYNYSEKLYNVGIKLGVSTTF